MSALRQSFAKGLVTMEDVRSRVIEQGVRTATYGIATAVNFAAIAALTLTVGLIIGVRVWPDAATALNIAEANRELIESGPDGLSTFYVDNVAGVDTNLCGTVTDPCATIAHVMSQAANGKPLVLKLVANGPSNAYYVSGDEPCFENGFSGALTFYGVGQVSGNDALPFTNWSRSLGSDTRTNQLNITQHPTTTTVSPIPNSIETLAVRSNTGSGNLGGLSQAEARCAAADKDASMASVTRYAPTNDALYVSTGYVGSSVDLYTPNVVLVMDELTMWAPMTFLGVDVHFNGTTRIESLLTIKQSRAILTDSTMATARANIEVISGCIVGMEDATFTMSTTKLDLSAGSTLIMDNTGANIDTSNIQFSRSYGSIDNEFNYLFTGTTSTFQIDFSVIIGGLSVRTSKYLAQYSVFFWNYDDMETAPSTYNSEFISGLNGEIKFFDVSVQRYFGSAGAVSSGTCCYRMFQGYFELFQSDCLCQADNGVNLDMASMISGDWDIVGSTQFTALGSFRPESYIDVATVNLQLSSGGFYTLAPNGSVAVDGAAIIDCQRQSRCSFQTGTTLKNLGPTFIYNSGDSTAVIYASPVPYFMRDAEIGTFMSMDYASNFPSEVVFTTPSEVTYTPTIGGTATLPDTTNTASYTGKGFTGEPINIVIEFGASFAVSVAGTITFDVPFGTVANVVGTPVGTVTRTGGVIEPCYVATTTTFTCTFVGTSIAAPAVIDVTYTLN